MKHRQEFTVIHGERRTRYLVTYDTQVEAYVESPDIDGRLYWRSVHDDAEASRIIANAMGFMEFSAKGENP